MFARENAELDFNHWVMFSSPAISGQMLYIGSNRGPLNAVDLKTQKTAWFFETENSKKNGPTYTKPDGLPNYEAAFFDFFYDDMVSGVHRSAKDDVRRLHSLVSSRRGKFCFCGQL
jgi:hypothetical protein